MDWSNYATKTDFKNAIDVDTSKFGSKVNLANLKSNVGKLDIDKSAPVSLNLRKLSNVVKIDAVKIDLSNAKIISIEDKIPDNTNLATKTIFCAKINEVKGEIPNNTNLATTAAIIAVENKIPNVTILAKIYWTNITVSVK